MTRLLLGRTIHLAIIGAVVLGAIVGAVLTLVTVFVVMVTS